MKKIIISSFVASAALCAVLYTNTSSAKVSNELTLANIEALSDYEIIVGWDKDCKPGGNGCCPCPYCWLPNDEPY